MAGWLQLGAGAGPAARGATVRWGTTWPGSSPRPGILRVERWCYRLCRIDPQAEQTWRGYATSLLAFSVASVLLLYLMLRLQATSPCPWGTGRCPPALAFNTAVSFVTNTNWQNYSGEQTLGYAVQMAGLTVQNFVSAAVGIAVALALVRGLIRAGSTTVGNFWVDLVRACVRILLPLAFVFALLLVSQGVVQNLHGAQEVATLSGGTQADPRRPGRLPGGNQGTGDEWRRLLQRQFRPSLREPDAGVQSGGGLPAAGDPVLADRDLREDGRGSPPGLRDRRGHADALGGLGPAPVALRVGGQPRLPRPGGRGEHGGQGGPLRRGRHFPVRRLDHRDFDGGGQRRPWIRSPPSAGRCPWST